MHIIESPNYKFKVYLQILNMFILTEHGLSLIYSPLFIEHLTFPWHVSNHDSRTALAESDKTPAYTLLFVYWMFGFDFNFQMCLKCNILFKQREGSFFIYLKICVFCMSGNWFRNGKSIRFYRKRAIT